MKRTLALTLLFLAGCTAESEPAFDGRWRSNGPAATDISITLGRTGTGGCGEFRYQRSELSRFEFLVSCTADGNTWTEYLVDTYRQTATRW